MSTGYFGLPGQFGGKTHYVLDGKPICGVKLSRKNKFHFCAAGFHEQYLECQRCKKTSKSVNSLAAQQGRVMVPREVLDFYNFCDMAFVPFTSQQEELLKSLKLARKAILSAAKLAQKGEPRDEDK